MISLPALLILLGLILWFFTIYGTLGLVLFILGIILLLAGYPFGWYSRRGPPV